jgi:hypothetical protein
VPRLNEFGTISGRISTAVERVPGESQFAVRVEVLALSSVDHKIKKRGLYQPSQRFLLIYVPAPAGRAFGLGEVPRLRRVGRTSITSRPVEPTGVNSDSEIAGLTP